MSNELTFSHLVDLVQQIHDSLCREGSKAVNVSLTLRNGLIGFHVAEFQLRGADRAAYGENLLFELSKELTRKKVSACGFRQLYRYLAFYRAYPQILRSVPAKLGNLLPTVRFPVSNSASAKT